MDDAYFDCVMNMNRNINRMTINLLHIEANLRIRLVMEKFGPQIKCLEITDGPANQDELSLILFCFPFVEKLVLSDIKTNTKDDVKRRKINNFDMENLKSLSLKRCGLEIENFFLKMPIEKLRIFTCKTKHQVFVNTMIQKHSKIIELEIDITGKFKVCIKNLDELKILDLRTEPMLTAEHVDKFIYKSNELTSLDITGVKINDDVLKKITTNMKQLKVFKINFEGLYGTQIKSLADLPNLTELKIEFSEMENGIFNAFCDIQTLKVTKINFVFFDDAPIRDLITMATNNKQLEHVAFYNINVAVANVFLNYCKNIHTFEGVFLKLPESIFIPYSSFKSPKLRTIKVSHSIFYHTDYFPLLIADMHTIEELDFCIDNDKYAFSDECFKSILTSMKGLRRLALNIAHKLTEYILDIILECGARLEYVMLQGCTFSRHVVEAKLSRRQQTITFNLIDYGG